MAKRVTVGDRMPSFELSDQDGVRVSSAALLEGGGPLVVYFYPKDDTPGCTAEACGFRDAYEAFVDAGATVVGISSDGVTRHKAFATRYRLPFTLLADHGGAVRRAFGVPPVLGLIPGRSTYVVDGRGVVRHVFDSMRHATRHVDEARRVVEQLSGTRS